MPFHQVADVRSVAGAGRAREMHGALAALELVSPALQVTQRDRQRVSFRACFLDEELPDRDVVRDGARQTYHVVDLVIAEDTWPRVWEPRPVNGRPRAV